MHATDVFGRGLETDENDLLALSGQLFGLMDAGFADPFIALTRVVRMLTAPPPEQFSEGIDGTASPVGSELMYYWSTIVIRLCFGSFVVAILVGAFNKVTLFLFTFSPIPLPIHS